MPTHYCPRCKQALGHADVRPPEHDANGCIVALAHRLQLTNDRILGLGQAIRKEAP